MRFVTEENMKKALIAFSFILLAAPLYGVKDVKIVTRSLPDGQNGVAYSSLIKAKFGTKPYTCTKTGTMPTGLTLNASCTITGTPTVNGIYTVTYTVTDSAGSPTVDSRTLSITISGSVVTTAVKLETAAVPDGQVGVAYNANFNASGGTAPYTYSKVSGSFPPGISLASATLSGTPTASTTSTFVIRATDANSQVDERAYALNVADAVSPTYVFTENFESNSMSSFRDIYGYATQGTVKHAGSYAAGARYLICGDSTNPACGSSHQDQNYAFERRWDTDALSEIWVRGYFYIKTPESGASHINGKKLFYFTAGCFGCSLWPSGDPWSMGVAANRYYSLTTHPGAGPLKLSWFLQNGNVGGSTFSIDCGNGISGGAACAMQYDTWYSLELRVKYNTNAVAPFNGEVQIFLDGVSVYNSTTSSLNRASPEHLFDFRFGAQVDRDLYRAVDEYRYVDDIIFNTSYIGP